MPKPSDKRSHRRRGKSPDGHEGYAAPAPVGKAPATPSIAEASAAVSHEGGLTVDVLPVLEPDMFINRELSWLDFNSRVLAEARELANPLLERVKFAGIFSSNLDEFFMIRVAGIKRKITAGIAVLGPDGRTPTQQLHAVREQAQQSLSLQARLIGTDLLPELAAHGIVVRPYDELTAAQQEVLTTRFEAEIYPILTPQAIDRGRRFPHVSNQSLNLIVSLELPEGSRYARVKIPATLPRFIPVLGRGRVGGRG